MQEQMEIRDGVVKKHNWENILEDVFSREVGDRLCVASWGESFFNWIGLGRKNRKLRVKGRGIKYWRKFGKVKNPTKQKTQIQQKLTKNPNPTKTN